MKLKNQKCFISQKKNGSKRKLVLACLCAFAGVANLIAQNASYQSNNASISGLNNSGFGWGALNNSTSGSGNSACGYKTLNSNTTGSSNAGSGARALFSNTTGDDNSGMGHHALFSNITGSFNTANGSGALYSNTIGNYNTALGFGADVSTNNLVNATAIGANAIVSTNNAMQLGDGNVTQVFAGTGTNATLISGGLQITGGSPATGKVLTSNASGVATWQTIALPNTAWSINGNAGTTNSSFIGTTDNYALNFKVNNQMAGRIDQLSGNTFLGYQAAPSVTSGDGNSVIGAYALSYNGMGRLNSALGFYSLLFNVTGILNTAVGSFALTNNITGNSNTTIGAYADVNGSSFDDATAIGSGAIVMNSHDLRLGSTTCTLISGNPAVYTGSDARFKTSVNGNDVVGLEFIKRLRPVVYNFDTKKQTEFITKNMPDSIRKRYMDKDFAPSTAIRQSGFIAQEVEKAAMEVGYNFHGIHKPDNDNDYYSLAYSVFVVPLVKAVQEQQQMIEDLKQEVKTLKNVTALSDNTKNTTGVNFISGANPEFSMDQNIPNPFTNETVINYSLPQTINNAYIAIYDLTGKQITSLFIRERGASSITFTSEKLAAGIYIYSIIADGKIMDSKRMVVAEK